MDSGYAEQQFLLDQMEYKINRIYAQAEKELDEKIKKYYKDFKRLDEKKLKEVDDGKLSMEHYKEWRKQKVMSGKIWEQKKEAIAKDLYNANDLAYSVIYEYMPDIYASGHNFGTYEIEKGAHIDTSYTLYDHDAVERLLAENPDLLPKPKLNIAKDLKWNKTAIQGVMLQGLLQGDSIPHLAKRLSTATGERNRKACIRNARTMATSAHNGGKFNAFKRAEAMGVELVQVWKATFDGRTRDTHRLLDGEKRKVGEVFSNGCRFPADPQGVPSEVYNCRCKLKGVPKGLEPRAEKYRVPGKDIEGLSYEEWKKGHNATHMKPKAQPKHKPEKKPTDNRATNKVYEERLRNKIYETYDKHIDANNLQLLKTADFIEEKDKKDFSAFNAYWGNLDNETVKPFTEQLIKLMDEYDTPLYNIRFFDKMDMLGQKNAFAYVYHDYRLDRAEMRINPVKCANDKMLSRLKELKAQRYLPQIKDGTESVYIVTHEFGHTLLELTEKFPNKQNWAGADFKHLQNVRKDIYSVYNEYLKELEKAEKRWQDAELKVLNGDMTKEVVDNAIKYRKEYDEIFISKYALTNENEFMAECFASAMLSEKPNKYSLRVKKILDDNFKRKK